MLCAMKLICLLCKRKTDGPWWGVSLPQPNWIMLVIAAKSFISCTILNLVPINSMSVSNELSFLSEYGMKGAVK